MKATDGLFVCIFLFACLGLIKTAQDIKDMDEFKSLPEGHYILRQCPSFENSNMIRCAGKQEGDRIFFVCQDGYQKEISRFADFCQARRASPEAEALQEPSSESF